MSMSALEDSPGHSNMDHVTPTSVRTRISPVAFQAATGVLFGLAMIAWVFRVYIQLTVHKRFFAEDWVLLLGVAILIGTTVLCYLLFPRLYLALDLAYGMVTPDLLAEVVQELPTELAETEALTLLWWFVIYSVKLAFLLFFRKLIARLRSITRYW